MNKALKYQQKISGIKLSTYIEPDVTNDYLKFLQQIGTKYCYTWLNDSQMNYDFIASLKERTAKYGITLYNAGNLTYGKSAAIHLGLPEREEHIEIFSKFIEDLSRAGVNTTTITWEPNGTLGTSDTQGVIDVYGGVTRGGAATRVVDMKIMNKMPFSHGREYSKEEIWENFEYFAKRIKPVIESNEVRVSLHPNDPPVDSVAGIATLIQNSQDYRRAFEIADSDFFGMEFCCGCWLEGGISRFGNIKKDIKEFVTKGKVFIVHFRNVSGTLPHFVETFVDDGYQNMYELMKTFVETGYSGTLIMDHSPTLISSAGVAASTAYANGYLKALLKAAETENL